MPSEDVGNANHFHHVRSRLGYYGTYYKRQRPERAKIFGHFDWEEFKALRTKIRSLPGDATLQEVGEGFGEREHWQFNRAHKFVSHYRDVHHDTFQAAIEAMIELAAAFDFSVFKAARLYIELQNLCSSLAIRQDLYRVVDNKKNPLPGLEALTRSLDILSRFSASMLDENRSTDKNIAKTWIEHQAWAWANRKMKSAYDAARKAGPNSYAERDDAWNEVKSLGFDLQETRDPLGKTTIDVSHESIVVRKWLETTILMKAWVREAVNSQHKKNDEHKQKLADKAAGKLNPDEIRDLEFWEGLTPPNVRIFGEVLPHLYERYTGRRFGFVRGEHPTAQDTTGVKFVRLAQRVMGQEPTIPETIAGYVKYAKLHAVGKKRRRKPKMVKVHKAAKKAAKSKGRTQTKKLGVSAPRVSR